MILRVTASQPLIAGQALKPAEDAFRDLRQRQPRRPGGRHS